jgi:hypothetical protein
MKKLHGFIQSGMIFIGDPAYMAGDLSQPGSETIVDLTNPFYNWPQFTKDNGRTDVNLTFPGAISDDSEGRGVVAQTNIAGGSYVVEKDFCPETGKLKQIRIVFAE